MIEFLKGKKTYIIAVAVGALAAGQQLGYEVPEVAWLVLNAFGLGFMRAAIGAKV